MPAAVHCPQIEYWQALFGDRLSPGQRELYERHLESCPACQERLDRHEEDGGLVRRLGRQFGDPVTTPAEPGLTHVLDRLSQIKAPAPTAGRGVVLPVLAALALLGLGSSLALAAAAGGNEPAREDQPELHQQFEGSTELTSGLRWFGIRPERCVAFEPAGLRITLPPGYQGYRPGTGVVTSFGLKGDFEVTLGFEILQEGRAFENPDRPTGLSLEVVPVRPAERDPEQWLKPSQNRAAVVRSLEPRKRAVFLAQTTLWNPTTGQDEPTPRRVFPTNAHAGRLRLVRIGADLSFLNAEEAQEEFALMHKEPFGDKDVKQVRVLATTSGPSAALTVRLKELRIRAQGFTRMPASAPHKPMWRPPLAALPLLLVVPLGACLGVWLYRRSKSTAPPAPDNPESPLSEQGALSFSCPACGKKLKTRAELAGKKLKCRACGQVIEIPAGPPPGPDPDPSGAIRQQPE